MTKKQKQSPSFSSTFFFTRKNSKSVGIFLRLTTDLYFSKRIKPRPKKEGHHKKKRSRWRGNGINGNNTQPPLLCSQEILVLVLQGLNWRIESIRKTSASAVIVGHTYLY